MNRTGKNRQSRSASPHVPTLATLRAELRALASPAKARTLQGFFKTGQGQYGEGDVFIGLTVPETRRIAKTCRALPTARILSLLHSRVHEERLLALLIMVDRYEHGDSTEQRRIYKLYMANTASINNWDLVDLSAPNIAGAYLLERGTAPLRRLAHSGNLWERRIAMVATHRFIRAGRFDETLHVAGLLLHDTHDLIHKAVGWMLREIGKRNQAVEEAFLKQHGATMPRTMLRYAIERFDEPKRQAYLNRRTDARHGADP